MRIGFLGSASSWYLGDLRRAARGRHEISAISFAQLSASVHEHALGVASGAANLSDFDAVLVRSMPPGSLEQVVFRMDALGQWEANGSLLVNSARALEIAIDKYLSLVKLQRANLCVPTTIVCQTVDEAMRAYAELGGDVVIKPIFGGEGRGITRVSDEALAWRAANMLAQNGAVLYLQNYLEHEGYDYRLLVLGDKVLGMIRRNDEDWRTNVSRGAATGPLTLTDELREIACRAAEAVGAGIAAVDLLPARDGRLYALEVNAVPGWRALSRTIETDVAHIVLKFIETRLS
jgi:ribosomal protein S6--L-glutamate ligase